MLSLAEGQEAKALEDLRSRTHPLSRAGVWHPGAGETGHKPEKSPGGKKHKEQVPTEYGVPM